MAVNKISQVLLEPGIIRIQVEPDSFLDVDDILAMRKVNLELSGGERFSVLLDTTAGYFGNSPEAIRMLASEEYLLSRKATAIVVKSLAARLAGNFFKKLNTPKCPTRLFTSEEDAIKWLRKF